MNEQSVKKHFLMLDKLFSFYCNSVNLNFSVDVKNIHYGMGDPLLAGKIAGFWKGKYNGEVSLKIDSKIRNKIMKIYELRSLVGLSMILYYRSIDIDSVWETYSIILHKESYTLNLDNPLEYSYNGLFSDMPQIKMNDIPVKTFY